MNTNKYITTVVAYQESRVGEPDKGSWLVSWMDRQTDGYGRDRSWDASDDECKYKYEYEQI